VFAGERAQQRRFPDPAQPVEAVQVVRQLVVLHQPTILHLVGGDDREVRLVDQPIAMDRLSTNQIGAAMLLQDRCRHAQLDHAVDRAGHVSSAGFPGGASLVPLEDPQLVAQEARRVGPGVGDQRLRVGQFQLEGVTQERRQLGLDLLRFGARPGEAKQEVG